MEIYVYGTGCGAGDLADHALPAEHIRAFIADNGKGTFLDRPVISPEELAGRAIDLVIITDSRAEIVSKKLLSLGIEGRKLLFLKNHYVLIDRNSSYALAETVLGKAFTESLKASERLIRTPLWAGSESLSPELMKGDYIRKKTLEMIIAQISELYGNVAELGVFRGEFACCLNALLPDRRLFLFDTFTGFSEKEAATYGEGFVQAHKNTDAEAVLKRLPHPEQAVLRPGLFPESALGLEEERFILVSLDVDLEQSTLEGLRWFAPKMLPGGMILLHDYNNPKLPGIKKALQKYEAETGSRLHRVPVADINGTLVLSF